MYTHSTATNCQRVKNVLKWLLTKEYSTFDVVNDLCAAYEPQQTIFWSSLFWTAQSCLYNLIAKNQYYY